MTDQPATLETNAALLYIQQRRGLNEPPVKTTLNHYQRRGYIKPYIAGNKSHAQWQNVYLVSDLALLCDRLDNGYYRKLGWKQRQEQK